MLSEGVRELAKLPVRQPVVHVLTIVQPSVLRASGAFEEQSLVLAQLYISATSRLHLGYISAISATEYRPTKSCSCS